MKASELRLKTVSELKEELQKFHREKMNLRFQRASRESVSPSRIRIVRRAIARLKTVLSEVTKRGVNGGE